MDSWHTGIKNLDSVDSRGDENQGVIWRNENAKSRMNKDGRRVEEHRPVDKLVQSLPQDLAKVGAAAAGSSAETGSWEQSPPPPAHSHPPYKNVPRQQVDGPSSAKPLRDWAKAPFGRRGCGNSGSFHSISLPGQSLLFARSLIGRRRYAKCATLLDVSVAISLKRRRPPGGRGGGAASCWGNVLGCCSFSTTFWTS